MRILKPIGEELEFDGKVRHLLFNINVIDEIQEHYDMYIVDTINSIFDNTNKENQKKSYNTLAYILTVLLNEDVRLHNKKNPKDTWDKVTEEYLKEEVLTAETSARLSILMLNAFNGNLPKSEEDDDPNQKSERTKK